MKYEVWSMKWGGEVYWTVGHAEVSFQRKIEESWLGKSVVNSLLQVVVFNNYIYNTYTTVNHLYHLFP